MVRTYEDTDPEDEPKSLLQGQEERCEDKHHGERGVDGTLIWRSEAPTVAAVV